MKKKIFFNPKKLDYESLSSPGFGETAEDFGQSGARSADKVSFNQGPML
jgi:hypothetical protein